MKIYQGLSSDSKAFDLEKNKYEELKNDILNGKSIIIKCKDDYIKMIRNINASSCGTCFFYKKCNEYLKNKTLFDCAAYKIIGKDEWKFYEFKKVDEYEVVFGGNNYEEKI